MLCGFTYHELFLQSSLFRRMKATDTAIPNCNRRFLFLLLSKIARESLGSRPCPLWSWSRKCGKTLRLADFKLPLFFSDVFGAHIYQLGRKKISGLANVFAHTIEQIKCDNAIYRLIIEVTMAF